MTILDEILATKRDEVTVLRQPQTRDLLRKRALDGAPLRDFAGALRKADGTLAVIGELKRRSPSKGDLAPDLDPGPVAKAYEAGGAGALSVLTDGPFFGGAVSDLQVAREATTLPVLRKDFTIDEIQIYEARAIGADAILLICAAIPDDALLADLQALAWELGMAVLVETHDGAEVERALNAGARIVGVNSRDLATFNENLAGASSLASMIPTPILGVAESSIRSVDDAVGVARAGFDAVLVGEALVRSSDPTALVRELSTVHREPRSAP
ncbi:MAG TPA: indole-3-glycerol phosphate synthase TrpC [Acidimicrobiia bacterium]|jgi:indole-3-glycerol phosphate synthase|nr:indole-3-glycerol phosphate synthase TrpC [Acidimicrobiia bacterium]